MLFPRWLQARLAIPGALDISAGEAEQLRQLATVVLPASLGRTRTDDVADKFVKWIHGYKAGADLGYGYGFTRPRNAPANPASQYPQQLQELEAEAQARGSSFGGLVPPAQRETVSTVLERAKIEAVPRRPNGQHVAADLMSFFFYVDHQGEDFLYQAAIEREECRGLSNSGEQPAVLK